MSINTKTHKSNHKIASIELNNLSIIYRFTRTKQAKQSQYYIQIYTDKTSIDTDLYAQKTYIEP